MATSGKKAETVITDARVDAYIAKSAAFAQPILIHLRALVHRAVPDVVETIKWSMPFFTHANGKVICNMSAFKAHAAFGIWNVGAVAELKAGGFTTEGAMGSLGRVTSLKDLPADQLIIKLLKLAATEAAAGKSMMRRASPKAPRAAIEIHSAFAAALDKNTKAAASFEAFSPSHQREYAEWIADAKREETRDKRIAQAIEWLETGKKRNWKYEDC